MRELGLDGAVALLGFDPNPLKYMARAYALLQSSVSEGLPGTLIQSMAVGTPVIATDCNYGPREVVASGVDGWLVPVGDAAALAARAIDLLEDPAKRDAFARSARASATARFRVSESIARYERAILGEAPP